MSMASLDEAPPDEVADKDPSFREPDWNLSSMDMTERRVLESPWIGDYRESCWSSDKTLVATKKMLRS